MKKILRVLFAILVMTSLFEAGTTQGVKAEELQVQSASLESRMYIDSPSYDEKIYNAPVKISGWALNESGIKEVEIVVDGKSIGKATIGIARPDVDTAYPGYPNGSSSGYEYLLDVNPLSPGKHHVEVKVIGNASTQSREVAIHVIKPEPRIYLDAPDNNETVHNKPIRINGWALNASGVQEVKVFVDGQVVGNAKTGLSRSDVDKAYPGYTNGENSGYEYVLNVDPIKVGKHHIAVEAIGVDDTKISRSVEVNITKPEPAIYIDSPISSENINNKPIKIRGWALNGSGMKAVKISIDGQELGNALTGLSRPDVDKAYPGYIDGANSGYEYTLDITSIKPGNHYLTVEGVGIDGSSQKRSVLIKITKPQPITYIDSPSFNENINNKPIKITGWTLNASGVKEVKILIDGSQVGTAKAGLPRPDVDKVYPGYVDGINSGYEYTFDTNLLKPGRHQVTIETMGIDGSNHTRSVEIVLLKPDPMIFVDTPTYDEKIDPSSVAQVRVSGWALNASGVKEIKVFLNGQLLGNANMGIARPDVDSIFPGYNNGVNSGYEFILASSKLAKGKNIITIQTIGIDNTFLERIIVVDNPTRAITIMLDPGHGGKDPGALNGSIREKDLNNSLTKIIAQKLIDLGMNVIYTRNPDSDIYLSLEERAEMANQKMPDLFMSIHHDSATVKGFSAFYSSYRPNLDLSGAYFKDKLGRIHFVTREVDGVAYYIDNGVEKGMVLKNPDSYRIYDATPSSAAIASKKIANMVYDSMDELSFIEPSYAVTDRNIAVTRWTNMPSILIEGGPTSAKLANKSNQYAIADKVVNAISNYFKK